MKTWWLPSSEWLMSFAEISDNIEVIMLPKNDDWIKNPPDAQQTTG